MKEIQLKELENLKKRLAELESSIEQDVEERRRMRLQCHNGAVDAIVEARGGIWWILKGSKIRAGWAKKFCNPKSSGAIPKAIEKRLEMHQNGVAILSDDRESFIIQEDFPIAPTSDDETMNLSPVATFATQSSSNGRGFEEIPMD